jgi:predicted nucleic acid-binding Zn ribbon protein
MIREIDCAVCGRRFAAARADAEMCSTTCRVRRHRERRAARAVRAAALLAEHVRKAREVAASALPTDPEHERLINELRRLADVAERTTPAL